MSDQTAQDPLAALEELLKKQQAKQQGSSDQVGGVAGAGQTPTEQTTAPEAVSEQDQQLKAEQEKAHQLAEYEKLKQQRAEEDQAKLQEQIAELAKIAETPQEQARQQQHKQIEDQRAGASVASDGFEIRQIDHTKV